MNVVEPKILLPLETILSVCYRIISDNREIIKSRLTHNFQFYNGIIHIKFQIYRINFKLNKYLSKRFNINGFCIICLYKTNKLRFFDIMKSLYFCTNLSYQLKNLFCCNQPLKHLETSQCRWLVCKL